MIPLVLVALLCSPILHVAEPAPLQNPPTQTANPAIAFKFDIPAGPIDRVLDAFQAVTGARISVPTALGPTVQVLPSPGVTGTWTAAEALERLLAGTGLAFRISGVNVYTVDVQPISEMVQVSASLPGDAGTAMSLKTLTPLRDVPQSITVITHRAIAEQRMQSIADVVRYVPGVGVAQGEGNRDTPVLRGNSTTADFYVDGVRDDVQYFRDLYNVERVEALKGPNAMLFGRGGAGGVINRATRQADWNRSRELVLQAGSFGNARATFDVGHPVNGRFAARLTGVYENSDSYRDAVGLERYGFNPTLAFIVGDSTTVRVGYERFHDERTADRGIPSDGNRPVETDVSTFFGDPRQSRSDATVDSLTSLVEHRFGADIQVRNRTRYAGYDKFYQNVYPASAVSTQRRVTLGAYNNATERHNVFNQTDLNLSLRTGRIEHALLAGAEFGRQLTDNFRNTGYFTSLGPNVTSYSVSVDAPGVSVPVTFRQSATDADNHGVATVAAVYAQDQVELTSHLQAVAGVRFDRFDVDFRNNRTGAVITSTDNLVSPRAGLIFKPAEPVSLYASYSLAYVPRAGEQLSSLSLTNQALDPEKFTNYELGAKWDVRSTLAVTAALYRLDRTNVVAPDPNTPGRSILVDGTRANGLEVGVSGRITRAWSVIGGYAFQDGEIRSTLSASAKAGAKLALVPEHAFSLWNRYDVTSRVGLGAGIVHNADMFTSTDNTVLLPAFTRVDGALFVKVTRSVAAQVNVENLFDARYHATSHGNNNIAPGSPRAVRMSLTTRF